MYSFSISRHFYVFSGSFAQAIRYVVVNSSWIVSFVIIQKEILNHNTISQVTSVRFIFLSYLSDGVL